MQLARAFIDDEAIDGPEEPDIGDEEPPGYDLEDDRDDVNTGVRLPYDGTVPQ